MEIPVTQIKELRERTSAGIVECKNALLETKGNIDKACDILQARGLAKAEKKAQRIATKGLIEAYVHQGGKVGALVEINCESDFVAHTDEFVNLAHNLALQVAAMAPQFVSEDEIPEASNLSPKEVCLLEQPFIKDQSKIIKDLISEAVSKVGEKISVRRFSRFELVR